MTEPGSAPTALVTGANRGIGFEVCRKLAQRGMTVVLGSRSPEKGEAAAGKLRTEGLEALPKTIDVADDHSVDRLADEIEDEFGRLNVLVNNAGILYDTWQRPLAADFGVVREALETNTFGAWRTARAFVPLMQRTGGGQNS